MCVIVRKPAGVEFTEKQFRDCWARNSHGVGYVAYNDKLEMFHSKGLMVLDEAISTTRPLWSKEFDLVLHFRVQSRGGISPKLTHPFSFDTPKELRFLFHNGTLRDWNSPNGSDTELLASCLSKLSNEDADKLIQILVVKGFGRFVTVCCPLDKAAFSVKVYKDNRKDKEVDGIWYSNVDHVDFTGPAPQVGDGAYKPETKTSTSKTKYSYQSSVDYTLSTILWAGYTGDGLEWQDWYDEVLRDGELNKLTVMDLATVRDVEDLINLLTLS